MAKIYVKTQNSLASLILILLLTCILSPASLSREIDMKPHWDETIALENPHKGWYHHFPDNHINKYIIENDSHLLDFPGMDHLYIRLAWAYLEPQEGEFNWDIIDSLIDKWVGHGLKIAFRISCKETSTDRIEQQYATPKWVMEAGAKGDYYRRGEKAGPDGPWEPVFDDPIFLSKLENFLKAFAERYDGKPWIRYIDIGSIGDWGEGHTSSGSRLHYDYAQRKTHVDLHLKYFKETQLMISDDFVESLKDPAEEAKMHQYIIDNGISYRDDSILVEWYVKTYPDTFTVRTPQYFADAYLQTPTVLELQHYHIFKRDGNWEGKPGSSIRQFAPGKTGPDMFRGALELLHATYIGYHGNAHDWLTENPELTVELLNRCGYWYFLDFVEYEEPFHPGEKNSITLRWWNKGVAPAYHPYELKIRLQGPDTQEITLPSQNQTWLGELKINKEHYTFPLPKTMQRGQYELKLKLYSPQEKRDVLLALDPKIRDKDGFYRIGVVNVAGDGGD